MGFFAADFVLGHVLLFFMLPAILIPYIDKFHSVMLFWLRPRYFPTLLISLYYRANYSQSPDPPSNLFTQAIETTQAPCCPLRYPVLLDVRALHHSHHWPSHRQEVYRHSENRYYGAPAANQLEQQRY